MHQKMGLFWISLTFEEQLDVRTSLIRLLVTEIF